MKIKEGNSYVCIKECKDVNGRRIPAGAICYVSKDRLLSGYNEDRFYTQVEPMDDYAEYFTLYEESPYNKEQKELRERYAGMAMQAILGNSNSSVLAAFNARAERDNEDIHKTVSKCAIEWVDALIKELSKEE